MSTPTSEEQAPPSLLNGFFILLIVVAAVVGWIAIGASLHLSSFYASFLFVWYWSTVEKLDFKKFVPSMIGAMLGIACAWSLHALPAALGTNGIILAIAIILAALYLVIIDRLPFAFNPALTLYLTVVAAPALLETSDFRELALATLLAGGFFGIVIFALMFIASKLSPPAAAES